VAGSDAAGALVLESRLVGGLHGAGDVRVDPERGGLVGVRGDAGVLADRETEPPAVYLFHRRALARSEPLGFRAAQPDLPIGDSHAGGIDRERRDVRTAVLSVDRSARERQ
jgi:hypothetical protein